MTGDALFLLLLCGHIVGAFLLQSEIPIQCRKRIDWLRPALLYLLSVTAFLLPYLTFTNLYVPLLMAIAWLPLEFLCTRPSGLLPIWNTNGKMGKSSHSLRTSLLHRHTGSMPQTGFILQNGLMFLLSARNPCNFSKFVYIRTIFNEQYRPCCRDRKPLPQANTARMIGVMLAKFCWSCNLFCFHNFHTPS